MLLIWLRKPVYLRVGEVNGRVFVNNSGVGFYPHFVRQREEEEQRGHVKRMAFVLALRSVVQRYFRLRMKAHMGREEALERVTPFLFVGNNRYQTSGLYQSAPGELPVAPAARYAYFSAISMPSGASGPTGMKSNSIRPAWPIGRPCTWILAASTDLAFTRNTTPGASSLNHICSMTPSR